MEASLVGRWHFVQQWLNTSAYEFEVEFHEKDQTVTVVGSSEFRGRYQYNPISGIVSFEITSSNFGSRSFYQGDLDSDFSGIMFGSAVGYGRKSQTHGKWCAYRMEHLDPKLSFHLPE